MVGIRNAERHSQSIRDSWERCSHQHGLLPSTRRPVLRLQMSELSPRSQAFRERIGGCVQDLDHLADLAMRAGSCLVVTDRDRVLVDLRSRTGTVADYATYGIAMGSCWDEKIAGTNGISMAMGEGGAFTVRGDDHFHSCFRPFACTSVPCLDAESSVIGALTLVTTDRRNAFDYVFAQHALSLAADRLQARLFHRHHAPHLTVRISDPAGCGTLRPNALVALDDAKRIVGVTAFAAHLMGARAPEGLIGQRLEALFDLDLEALPRNPDPVLHLRLPQSPRAAQRPAGGGTRGLGAGLRRLAAQGPDMALLIDRARKLVAHGSPLLICGDSGTGKSQFAEGLLEDLGRQKGVMLALDCDGLAANPAQAAALRSALDQARRLSAAPDDGCRPVLWLENVAALPAEHQAELAQFLTGLERAGQLEVRPGQTAAQGVVILSTVRGDWQGLATGGLRPDLLHLLGKAVIRLPNLRDRDLSKVISALLDQHRPPDISLSPEAEALLHAHDWPGNLRELASVLAEALVCGNGQRITAADLPARLHRCPPDAPPPEISLRDALDSAGWNVTKAAQIMGISRATINRRIAAEGLARPR